MRLRYILLILLMFSGFSVWAADPAPGGSATDLPGKEVLDNFRNDIAQHEALKNLPDGFTDGPEQDDLTYQMLRRLLGDPAVTAIQYFDKSDNEVGGVTAVALVLGLFPYIALFIASVLMIYWFFGGMFGTTATGELLGKRWDAWGTPVRAVSAYTLLLPGPPFAPLSGIQMIVLVLAMLGVGGASSVFSAVVQFMIHTPIITVENRSADEFTESIAHAALCLRVGVAHDKFKPEEARYFDVDLPSVSGSGNLPGVTEPRRRIEFGPRGVCGTVEYLAPSSQIPLLLNDQVNHHLKNSIRRSTREIIITTYQQVDARIIANIASGEIDINDKKIDEYAKRFDSIVEGVNAQLMRAAVSKDDPNAEATKTKLGYDLTRFGFATAGMVYWALERRQDAFITAIDTALPMTSEPITGQLDDVFWLAFWKDRPVEMDYSAKKALLDSVKQRYRVYYHPDGAMDSLRETINTEGMVAKTLNVVSRSFAELLSQVPRMFTDLSNDNPNPMMEIKMLGQQLQIGAVTIIAGGRLLEKFGIGFGSDDDDDDSGGIFADMISTLFQVIFFIALGLGFLYANIIPAMPYMMWMIAMIGYLVYILEALVAANFWAAMHTHPEGEGLIGRAGAGYPILLTLILYPILMVAGLVFGMAMVRVGGWFINMTLWTFIQDMNNDGANIFSMFGTLTLYAIIHMVMVYKAFSMTYELPQSVLRWMGVGSHFSDLGERDTKQEAMMVAGVVTRHISTHGSGLAGKATGGGGGMGGVATKGAGT